LPQRQQREGLYRAVGGVGVWGGGGGVGGFMCAWLANEAGKKEKGGCGWVGGGCCGLAFEDTVDTLDTTMLKIKNMHNSTKKTNQTENAEKKQPLGEAEDRKTGPKVLFLYQNKKRPTQNNLTKGSK